MQLYKIVCCVKLFDLASLFYPQLYSDFAGHGDINISLGWENLQIWKTEDSFFLLLFFIIIIYIQKILSLYYLLHTIRGQFQGLILGLNLSEFSSLLTMGYSHARAHLVHSWGLNRATFWKNDAFSSTQSADHQPVFIKIWLDEQGCLQAPRCSQWCLFLLPELHSENRRISLGLR
jgi:hypothetical protein